jgi:iron complex outermembrane receptor protein
MLNGYSVADGVTLDKVEVTGTATENYTPYDFIGSHQSINSEEFNQNFNTLTTILERQSGIEIQSIGGLGQYSSPVIRGSSGQQVLVFWDGMLLNNLSGGSADIGSLNLNIANKIDIYRSIAPAELSASAVGGVIHIQSAEPSDEHKNNGEATITSGSYGTEQVSILQNFSIGSTNWLAATEYLTADNDFQYLQVGSVINPNEPTLVPRYNNGAEQYSALLKGQHTLSSGRFDIAFQTSKNNRQLSSKINSESNQANIETQNNSVQFRLSHQWSKTNKIEILSGILKQTQLYDDVNSTIGLGSQLNEYETTGNNIQINHYLQWNEISGLLSARYQQENTETDFKLLTESELEVQCAAGRGCEEKYERRQHDFSGRIQYQDSHNQLTIQASQITIEDKNLTFSNSLDEFQGITWSFGVSHFFDTGLSTYINISNQVRTATTNELLGDRGTTIGNPDLSPEIAKHFEIGLSHKNEYLEIRSSLYLRDVTQAIIGEPDSRGILRFDNLGETQHKGMEHTLSWTPLRTLILTTSLTFQSNEIIQDDLYSSYEGKQVPGYSQFSSYSSIQWVENLWDLSISNTVERGGFYISSNLKEKDIKDRWDLSLGAKIKNWRLSLDAYDLTSNAARDFIFYPEPGRSYFLRAKTKW